MGFFDAILPSSGGVYYLVLKGQKTRHIPFDTVADLQRSPLLSTKTSDEVYFALGSYLPPVKGPDGRTSWRTHAQVRALRSFWMDLDCKDGQYSSRAEAIKAVALLCRGLVLPKPTLVDSGGGLHVYWALTEDIDADAWKELAQLFRVVRSAVRFRSDPARDVDASSILRAPGTLNHKYDPPRPVAVLHLGTDARPVAWWRDHLIRLAAKLKVAPPRRRTDRNSDLESGLYRTLPVDPEQVARECVQVRHMVDRNGDVSEPHWRLVLGLLKFCENGQQVAHEWSRGSPKYDPEALDDRWKRWNVGPPTCEAFRTYGEGSCDGCPHSVTTPLRLGEKPPAPPPPQKIPAKKTALVLPPFPPGYDKNSSGGMIRYVKSSKGGLMPVTFCHDELHVIRRISSSHAGAVCRIIALSEGVKGKRVLKSVDLPVSLIASGGVEFKRALGEKEIMASPGKDTWSHLAAFLQDELRRLQKAEEAIPVFSTFGWHGNSFALGDKLYLPDGTVRSASYMGAADEKKKAMVPEGTTDQWAEAVNWLYSRDGMEPVQYAIACSFGSVLGRFQPDIYHGIPLSIVGTGSGRGKTTACMVATSVYANSDITFVNSTLGATVNARNSLMSMLQNLPILIDEVTHIKADELSRLLYAVSNGADKLRMDMKTSGLSLADVLRWNLVTYLTSNAPLVDILSTSRVNSTPELMRIVEINTDENPLPRLDVTKVEKYLMQATGAAAAPGHAYVRYVVQNQKKMQKAVETANALLLRKLPFLGQGEYRFWRFQASCALAGVEAARRLGLVDFDITKLALWIFRHLGRNHVDMTPTTVVDYEELASSFLLSLAGQAITTFDYPRGSRKQSVIDQQMPRPNRPPVARVLLSDEKFGPCVIVLESYFKQWCSEYRVDRPAFIRWLKENAGAVPLGKFNITKGTPYPSSATRCICLRMSHLEQLTSGIYGVVAGNEAAQ